MKTTTNATPETQAGHLTAIYENWLSGQGRFFPCVPPEELLESNILTDSQRAWLHAFITIWNANKDNTADAVCQPRASTPESLKILDLLEITDMQLTAAQIAHRTGIYIGTVRGELPRLVSTGQVESYSLTSGPKRYKLRQEGY